MGEFIKNDFLTKYTFEADKSLEDILILKFTNRFDKSAFVLFIGYLPPDFSTRAVDGDAFFNDLSKKVYEYQSEGEIIICGDFNARLGSESDYIEGVDVVKPRMVIDTTTNSYCDILLDFLIDCNLCMLNQVDWEHMTLLIYPHEVNQLWIMFSSLMNNLQVSVSFQCNPCQI